MSRKLDYSKFNRSNKKIGGARVSGQQIKKYKEEARGYAAKIENDVKFRQRQARKHGKVTVWTPEEIAAYLWASKRAD